MDARERHTSNLLRSAALVSRTDLATVMGMLASAGQVSFWTLGEQFESAHLQSDRFKVCCALALLVNDRGLVTSTQRLAAFYLLAHSYRAVSSYDLWPFLPFLISCLAPEPPVDPSERAEQFLLRCLCNRAGASVQAMTAPELVAHVSSLSGPAAAPVVSADIFRYIARLAESPRALDLPSVCAVVPDPAPGSAAGSAPPAPELQCTFLRSGPSFMRLAPPPNPCGADEAIWFEVPVEPCFVWDPSYELAVAAPDQHILALAQAAMVKTLLPAEQKELCAALAGDRHLAAQLGLAPESLPAVINSNPEVAAQFILCVALTPLAPRYLPVLLSMDISLHSLEIVDRLVRAVELPREFMQLFVAHCISACYRNEDTQNRHRLVRIVCVFLQALVRYEAAHIRNSMHEIEAFCIEFSKMREAAGLFRLLRALDAGDTGQ
eukprot:c39962_g1_i1.p1 GENE.c39962_g1_i1~~c39962_g1_i1.p1  ORF type:complete len:436 (+),score=61.68 c39962_g1_i1:128-1435(+)